jgi:hypothetical protein
VREERREKSGDRSGEQKRIVPRREKRRGVRGVSVVVIDGE